MSASLDSQIHQTVETFNSLRTLEPQLVAASDLIIKTLRQGGRLLICGNGGSAAEAGHFATELTGRYKASRKSLPAIALSADGSLVTCIANDFGFEQIFARALEGLATSKDLLVVISSSGHSANLLRVLEKANELKLPSLALLGRSGGPAAKLATHPIVVPGQSGRTAQEVHLFLIHYFCEAIEEAFQ